MPKAAEVISFPLDAGTTGFLSEFSGDAQDRLSNVVTRLEDMVHLIYLARTSDQISSFAQCAFGAVEQSLRDCIAVAELRPVGGAA